MEIEIERLSKEGHPVVSLIGFQELNRRKTLEQDLEFYFGDDWANNLEASSSALAYQDRINFIANNKNTTYIMTISKKNDNDKHTKDNNNTNYNNTDNNNL